MSPQQLLQIVDVATPCRADWDSMTGDDRSRFCGQCRKHVYNLSAMPADQAVALIREREGDLCIRLYRRMDGTVLSGDCPIGVGRVWKRLKAVAAGVTAASLLGLSAALLPNVTYSATAPATGSGTATSMVSVRRSVREFWDDLRAWLGFTTPTATPVMGDICISGAIAPLPPTGSPVSGTGFDTVPETSPAPRQVEPASEF